MDRETRSSILPIRTRYRFSSVVERGPPKPDVDCSIQSAGANLLALATRSPRLGSRFTKPFTEGISRGGVRETPKRAHRTFSGIRHPVRPRRSCCKIVGKDRRGVSCEQSSSSRPPKIVMNQAMCSIQLIGGRLWILADRDVSATPGKGRNHGVQS